MGRGGYKQINKALNICAFEDYLDSQVANLPHLNDVEQISPRVIRILGQNEGKVCEPSPAHQFWQLADDPSSSPSKEQTRTSSELAGRDLSSTPVRGFQNGQT